jgi:hypothetical protein
LKRAGGDDTRTIWPFGIVMVDNLALLISHGMLFALIWRLMSLRDPEEPGLLRHRPDKKHPH